MIIGSCTACSLDIENLKAIQIQFLLSNVCSTYLISQGVVHSFKSYYQKILIKRIIIGIKNKKLYVISILEILQMAQLAWKQVSQNTISHFFCYARFIKNGSICYYSKSCWSRQLFDVFLSIQKISFLEVVNIYENASVDRHVECTEDFNEDEPFNHSIPKIPDVEHSSSSEETYPQLKC